MIPVVFSHCSSSVFAFFNFPYFGQQNKSQLRLTAGPRRTRAVPPSRMAASTCGRLHELHGFQHLHQFGALFLHELQRVVLVTRAGSDGSFSLRGYHYLMAICWVCCGVSIFSVGGLERGSGIGVDPPHHGRVAFTFPQILNQRLSRVRSAEEVFALVDSHSKAFDCIHLGLHSYLSRGAL